MHTYVTVRHWYQHAFEVPELLILLLIEFRSSEILCFFL
jgi:hypothetical protein